VDWVNVGSCFDVCKKGHSVGPSIATPLCVKTHIVLRALALRLRRRISGNLDEVYSRENIMSKHRSELQNEVARALIESKAVDLEVVGKVLGQFGARAAMSGETIGAIIGRRCWDICIPPEPYGVNVAEIAGAANR
jgi:hypothetical protein